MMLPTVHGAELLEKANKPPMKVWENALQEILSSLLMYTCKCWLNSGLSFSMNLLLWFNILFVAFRVYGARSPV